MAGTINGNLGSTTFKKVEKVYSDIHPPVILTMEAKASQGTLARGTIVAKDANGLIVPYAPAATDTTATPVGVLTEDVDTTAETSVNVLVHGIVYDARLIVSGGSVAAADLDKLASITIWNIG